MCRRPKCYLRPSFRMSCMGDLAHENWAQTRALEFVCLLLCASLLFKFRWFGHSVFRFQSQAQPGVTRSNSSGKQGLAAPGWNHGPSQIVIAQDVERMVGGGVNMGRHWVDRGQLKAAQAMKMRDSSSRPATQRRCGRFCLAFLCCL